MVEIHIYGKLRRYVRERQDGQGNVMHISPQPEETVASLLVEIGIPENEIYSIFFNSKLLAARSGMARWIGYQQIGNNPLDWDLNIAVKPGDRIGLFGRDMAALVV